MFLGAVTALLAHSSLQKCAKQNILTIGTPFPCVLGSFLTKGADFPRVPPRNDRWW